MKARKRHNDNDADLNNNNNKDSNPLDSNQLGANANHLEPDNSHSMGWLDQTEVARANPVARSHENMTTSAAAAAGRPRDGKFFATEDAGARANLDESSALFWLARQTNRPPLHDDCLPSSAAASSCGSSAAVCLSPGTKIRDPLIECSGLLGGAGQPSGKLQKLAKVDHEWRSSPQDPAAKQAAPTMAAIGGRLWPPSRSPMGQQQEPAQAHAELVDSIHEERRLAMASHSSSLSSIATTEQSSYCSSTSAQNQNQQLAGSCQSSDFTAGNSTMDSARGSLSRSISPSTCSSSNLNLNSISYHHPSIGKQQSISASGPMVQKEAAQALERPAAGKPQKKPGAVGQSALATSRKLARSQPNLAPACARRQVRIPVPSGRRSQQPARGPAAAKQPGQLRERSKSTLGASSLPRRSAAAPASGERQPTVQSLSARSSSLYSLAKGSGSKLAAGVTMIPTFVGGATKPRSAGSTSSLTSSKLVKPASVIQSSVELSPAPIDDGVEAPSEESATSDLPVDEEAPSVARVSIEQTESGKTEQIGDLMSSQVEESAAKEGKRLQDPEPTIVEIQDPGTELDCSRCKSLQLDLSQLIKEKKQLNEQITELEELENDSRLMSQKLALKVKSMEEQNEISAKELQLARDAQSKIQFQNKRLTFELKQRFDTVHELQCQLNKAQAKLVASANLAAQKRAKQIEGHAKQSPSPSTHQPDDSAHNKLTLDGQPKCRLNEDDNASGEKSALIEAPESKQENGSIETERNEKTPVRSSVPFSQLDSNHDCELPEPKQPAHQIGGFSGTDSAYSKSSASSDDELGNRSDSDVQGSPIGEPKLEPASDDSNSNDENDTRTQQAAELAARQQVQRKKISTARIVRGVHVQTTSVTSSDPSADCRALLTQARFARVVTETIASEELSGRPEGQELGGRQATTDEFLSQLVSEQVESCEPEIPNTQNSDLMAQLKLEVASLRARLFQAQTLNDNLIGELKASQLDRKSVSQHIEIQPAGGQLIQQQQQQQLAHQQRASTFVGRPLQRASIGLQTEEPLDVAKTSGRRSVIYMNGNSGRSSHSRPDPEINELAKQPASVSEPLDEFLAFMSFLLDKVHFHHGRTFELMSECQKFAMNALVASHSHQLNLMHHSAVISAGNRLSQQQQAADHQCPVRAPPRRRSLVSDRMSSCEPRQPEEAAIKKPARQPIATGVRAGPTSALQVAKQTLFSIVPIYYGGSSGNSNNGTGGAGSNNNKEKAAKTSASRLGQQQNISVLQINRSNSDSLQQANGLGNESSHNKLQPELAPAGYPSQSQLMGMRQSLSEDIERYRVHFNGQLLDLLTRQNWCENLITEKMRSLQARYSLPANNQHLHCQANQPQQQQQQPGFRLQQPSGSQVGGSLRVQAPEARYSGAKQQLVSMTKSVPLSRDCISLDPSGELAMHHQQQQQHQHQHQQQPNQRQQSGWPTMDPVAQISFC